MAHTSEKLDHTVTAQLVWKNKVLLIYNQQYKAWFPPGGHIDKDEDIESAVYREIEEETGFKRENLEMVDPHDSLPKEDIFIDIEGRSIVTPTFTDVHEAKEGHTHVGFRYFFRVKSKVKIISNDEFVTKHKWFSVYDLKNPKYKLHRHVKYYASFALKLDKAKF